MSDQSTSSLYYIRDHLEDGRAVGQPVAQAIDESLAPSADQPEAQSMDQPEAESMAKSMAQSVAKSMPQSMDPPLNPVSGPVRFLEGPVLGETWAEAPDGTFKLVRPSSAPNRSIPSCPHFPQCGACTVQHISDAAELRLKVKEIREHLQRIGHWPKDQTHLLDSLTITTLPGYGEEGEGGTPLCKIPASSDRSAAPTDQIPIPMAQAPAPSYKSPARFHSRSKILLRVEHAGSAEASKFRVEHAGSAEPADSSQLGTVGRPRLQLGLKENAHRFVPIDSCLQMPTDFPQLLAALTQALTQAEERYGLTTTALQVRYGSAEEVQAGSDLATAIPNPDSIQNSSPSPNSSPIPNPNFVSDPNSNAIPIQIKLYLAQEAQSAKHTSPLLPADNLYRLFSEVLAAASYHLYNLALAWDRAGRLQASFTELGDPLPMTLLGTSFALANDSFFQVNLPVAAELFTYVADILADLYDRQPFQKICEFYAGTAVISQILHRRLSHLPLRYVAVENNPAAVADGRALAKAKGLELEYLQGKVEDLFGRADLLEDFLSESSVLILDPPRAGCKKSVLKGLKERGPGHLIYISCHPGTLSRDLSLLWPAYTPQAIRAFDMFPQTMHVETVVLLCKLNTKQHIEINLDMDKLESSSVRTTISRSLRTLNSRNVRRTKKKQSRRH